MTYSPAYTSLVAALCTEFLPAGITDIQVAFNASDNSAAVAVLHRALRDAADPNYDPGHNAHPAVRDHFERNGRQL
jgi:hypothetical protein